MKKVFTSSSEVIHLFAQRSQFEGKCSNVFFYDSKIYSYGYHYLLGEFITNKKNEAAIIINDSGYSSTTSKHISQIRQATRQYKQFFVTETDLDLVLSSVKSNCKKLVAARKKELYILPSQILFRLLNEYITWSGKTFLKKDERYKDLVRLMKVINGQNINEYCIKETDRIKRDAAKAAKAAAAKLKKQLELFENYEIDSIYNIDQDF